ncbi:isochorismatase [Sphingomonas sp. Leaf407]|jgi:nicotinamidase-related amidase|uniref:cysteine hydrolase family protein n=1 Tax=unclassified Sphingomonas TaxID=196159 RepID=UPI0006F955F2|nr:MULTISPECIES: cysteine hydrolase [unclassified Sphingomonas]KQN37278.1 isochorismatase [Sphingomonas sp. Leaf42]KQN80869.1 isochorismatase [Sphingomonas sp. Leaf67]KQT27646.1 isochorismatase [Sphingomonas sp. Leaf407]
MTPEKTALLLIEYQNDFVSEGGAQHDAVKAVMADTDMLAHSRAVATAARDRGVTVMHAPIGFADGYPEIPADAYGILAGIVQAQAFRKGSWGAEIAAAMAPVDGDIVIEGKRGLDCFASTNIDFILRQRGITDLAIAGFLTNCCVESTMRSAYERGFRVVTLTDCTATLSAEEQAASVTKTFPMFSRPLTHDAFLAELETTP